MEKRVSVSGIGFFGGIMLKIAVCDDEERIREFIKAVIGQTLHVEADLYASGVLLLEAEVSYDIYILDICLGQEENGMEIAKKLRSRTDAVLIFITALQEYVYEAYDVEAFRYLLKPVEEQKLAEALLKAAAKAERKQVAAPLFIKVNGRNLKISVADIFYAESDGRKIILHTKNGVFTYYEKMELLEQKLGERFFRSHRGFLVNLAEVAGYDRTSITLKCSDTVFLAKKKYGDFVGAYMDYLTKEENGRG